jgi:hypothetical protein
MDHYFIYLGNLAECFVAFFAFAYRRQQHPIYPLLKQRNGNLIKKWSL